MMQRHPAIVLVLASGLSSVTPACLAAQPIGCLIEPHQVVELGSPVIGVIETVPVERGSSIRKGQVLATLKADVERAAADVARSRAQAEADVQAAVANRDFNRSRLKRAEDLLKQNFISTQALDQARTEAEVAEQKLAQAREQKKIWDREHELARTQLSQRSLLSPLNGVVVERYLSPGERVEERPVLKIAALNPLRVELFMPAASYHDVKAGMSAVVYPELPNAGERSAKVILVDRIVDPASNTFRVRLELPNPGNELPAGLRCKVAIGDQVIGAEAKGAGNTPAGLKPLPSVTNPAKPAPAANSTPPQASGKAANPGTAAPPPAKQTPAAGPVVPPTPTAPAAAKPTAQAPFVTPAPSPEPPAKSVPATPKSTAARDGILATVEGWRKAWAEKDLKAYLAAYVADFRGQADSHDAWRKQREARVTGAGKLSVHVDGAKVDMLAADKARVSFRQRYQSDNLKSESMKTLLLVQQAGKWLIQEERAAGR